MNQKSPATTTPPRHAFTMIELVFIIVILGILGAIAVPKMAASREDALVVAIKQDVATIIQALPAYALSQGAGSLKKFSDAVTLSGDAWEMIPKGDARGYLENTASTLEGAAHIGTKFKSDGYCMTLRLADEDYNGIVDGLEIWTRSDSKCQKLGSYYTVIPLTGASVKF